jgi:hypothetical protein
VPSLIKNLHHRQHRGLWTSPDGPLFSLCLDSMRDTCRIPGNEKPAPVNGSRVVAVGACAAALHVAVRHPTALFGGRSNLAPRRTWRLPSLLTTRNTRTLRCHWTLRSPCGRGISRRACAADLRAPGHGTGGAETPDWACFALRHYMRRTAPLPARSGVPGTSLAGAKNNPSTCQDATMLASTG